MPFVLKQYQVPNSYHNKKIQIFLTKHLEFSLPITQKMLAKGRVFDHNLHRFQNGQKIKSSIIKIVQFEGISRGLKPLFTTNDFAIFDKPSGIMVHPSSRNTQYSLLDEIRYHFGLNANLAHRIDLETSGLVLVTRHKIADIALKEMFANKLYLKKYLAIVKGKVTNDITISTKLKKDTQSSIGVKMTVSSDGKESLTYVSPLYYNSLNDQTLIQAIPYTGRQHQLRIHLHSIGHTIIGDPIYGVDEDFADKYLLKQIDNQTRLAITGSTRLMLQAHYLEFCYKNIQYKIYSKLKF
jgi:23S rRNA pseudouridine1911/1915/1917 synthase